MLAVLSGSVDGLLEDGVTGAFTQAVKTNEHTNDATSDKCFIKLTFS
jgi:hypothetical protein